MAWIEAFDAIDLLELAARAKAKQKAAAARGAVATMPYERLAPQFAPPVPQTPAIAALRSRIATVWAKPRSVGVIGMLSYTPALPHSAPLRNGKTY